MIRFLALFVAATLSVGAFAADKPARARLSKAALVSEVNKDGEPNLASSGVLVLDPATGNTLYSKNADQTTPIASITKLMTAMVVLDGKLNLEEVVVLGVERMAGGRVEHQDAAGGKDGVAILVHFGHQGRLGNAGAGGSVSGQCPCGEGRG